jgi:hypothetical protein
MTRISTYVAAFALGAALLLTTASVQAQCAAANLRKDDCTETQCRALHDAQTTICNTPRSCNGVTAQEQRAARLILNQNCLAARQATGACFKTVDSNHQKMIDEAQTAINKCQ